MLPAACSDLVWEQGVGGYLAGPDTGPVRMVTKAGTVIVGVRFRPSAGGAVLGLPLSEIRDQRVPLADLLPAAARRLPATLSPVQAATRALDAVGPLVADGSCSKVADEIGLSERQLRKRCHAAAGYGPKTLQRVLRFQRFVRILDAAVGPLDLAAAAARVGYADQAHLTRECAALSGLTPATLARVRRGTAKAPDPGAGPGQQGRAQASAVSAIMAVPISRKPSLA